MTSNSGLNPGQVFILDPGVTIVEDRSLAVPEGSIVRTGYVRVDSVVLACKERMAVGDVEKAYRRRLQLGTRQPWPCPHGYWRPDGRFVIVDGRHDFVSCLMLGMEFILVAWMERADNIGNEPAGNSHN